MEELTDKQKQILNEFLFYDSQIPIQLTNQSAKLGASSESESKVVAFPECGTPTQQWTDSSLAWFDQKQAAIKAMNLEEVQEDAKEEIKQALMKLLAEVNIKITGISPNPLLDGAKRLMDKFSKIFSLIQPIISTNPTPDSIIKWAKNVVKFFKQFYDFYYEPYEKAIKIITYSSLYSIAFIDGCQKVLKAIQEKLKQIGASTQEAQKAIKEANQKAAQANKENQAIVNKKKARKLNG